MLLDLDTAVGDNKYIVEATNFTLMKVNSFNSSNKSIKEGMHSLSTNIGGRGINKGLANRMNLLSYCCNITEFITITCTYYKMNSEIQSLLAKKILVIVVQEIGI